jgi:hypothetical protein
MMVEIVLVKGWLINEKNIYKGIKEWYKEI